MPSSQVIEKLQNIQVELDKASAAITHINKASKVTASAANSLKQIPEFISSLKTMEQSHRKLLQQQHKEKIDEVTSLLETIWKLLGEKASQLSLVIEETKKVEKSIDNYLTEVQKIDFPQRLGKIDNQISSINIGLGNLQTSIQHTDGEIEKLAEQNELIIKGIKNSRVIQVTGIIISSVVLILLVIAYFIMHN